MNLRNILATTATPQQLLMGRGRYAMAHSKPLLTLLSPPKHIYNLQPKHPHRPTNPL